MTYAVFQYHSDKRAADRIKSIALMMLMQESKLKSFDVAYSDLNMRKISSNKTEVLAGYLACCFAETNAVSIVKFPSNLDGDEQLMLFGDEYLGCININLVKSELINRVELINSIDVNGCIKSWLTFKLSDRLGDLKSIAGLNDNEIAELKEIEKKQKNPYIKWIDQRQVKLNKMLKNLPNFIKREFLY